MSLPTYDEIVKHDAQAIWDAYAEAHGHPPAPADLAHNLYRRIVEGWTQSNILHDIRSEPLDVVQPPPRPEPKPGDPLLGCGDQVHPMAPGEMVEQLDLVRCLCEKIHPQGSIELALEVIARIAWALRDYGFGLLAKPGGENIIDYHGTKVSASRVMHRSGKIFKVLTDVPTTNGPQWADNGTVALNLFVEPINPNQEGFTRVGETFGRPLVEQTPAERATGRKRTPPRKKAGGRR